MDRPSGSSWWSGWIAIAIGLFGVFDHPKQASAFNVFRLLVGLNIVNDAIAIPVLLLVAWAVRRWAPAWCLVPVQVWLIVGGIVTLYAYPLVGSYGKAGRTPASCLSTTRTTS